MSYIIAILTASLVILSVLGETVNVSNGKLNWKGMSVILCAFILMTFEFMRVREGEGEILSRAVQIGGLQKNLSKATAEIGVLQDKLSDAAMEIIGLQGKLSEAASTAQQYHQESTLLALKEILPKDISIDISESTATNLSLLYIVFRLVGKWEVWIDTDIAYLCQSELEYSMWDDRLEPRSAAPVSTNFDTCAKYDLDKDARFWSPSRKFYNRSGIVDMSCINCPMTSTYDLVSSEVNVRSTAFLYKTNYEEWNVERRSDIFDHKKNMEEAGEPSPPHLIDGFSWFYNEVHWRIATSDLDVTEFNRFRYRTLLHKVESEEFEVFVVPKIGKFDFYERAVMIQQFEGIETLQCAMSVYEDVAKPCLNYFDEYPISLFYTGLVLDALTVTIDYDNEIVSFKTEDARCCNPIAAGINSSPQNFIRIGGFRRAKN